MTSVSLPGARESSAGDEFHILWALRRVLALLDPASGLERVVIEDLTPVPHEGLDPELLLAADMTEYYRGTELTSAERVIVSQLKYSHRHPDRPWTAARLAEPGSRGQKGVIARLADLHSAVSTTGTRDQLLGRLQIRLVSNMPCGEQLASAIASAKSWLAERPARARRADLLAALSHPARINIERLSAASRLASYAFTDFLRVLDLDYTGANGRAEQELAITQSVAEHVLDDLRYASLALLDLVRRRALPEGTGHPIERADVLAALEVYSEDDLFPAPARFRQLGHRVRTPDAARIIAALDGAAERRVLAHGAAGVGKTTSILSLQNELPPGSVVLTYDCFGDGDYETPGAARHDEMRFGVQLCNELAVRCRLPILIRPPRSAHDLWRELERRMRAAGELLQAQGARLIVTVDAADNSAWAGRRFGEDTFLRYLWSQPVPEGTGLVVTCRTGRKSTIQAPSGIVEVKLHGFDADASAQYLRARFAEATDSQARDFHQRSDGNPRVQFYVLFQQRAGGATDLAVALEQARLSPQDIFQNLFDAAVAQAASEAEARERLAEFVCLTKPLTSERFRVVSGLAAERVREFCESLVPGVVIEGDVIAFRDEDFANFLREEVGGDEQIAADSRLADLFLAQQSDPYAALVVADHLHNALRSGDLLDLALTAGAPEAIADPLARQQAYRRRLTLALAHATDEADRPAACRLVVLAAEAARQNRAVAEILRRRPDLGMRYGDPEAVMRVYADTENPEWHGPIHMQLAAFYARIGQLDHGRAEGRHADAWLIRWAEEDRPWRVEPDDVAAYTEAYFHVFGPDAAEAHLRRWRPADFAISAGVSLIRRLALSVPGGQLGELIATRELPVPVRAQLMATAFASGATPQAQHIATVAQLLISSPPALETTDGWWAATFAELAAMSGSGADGVLLQLVSALPIPQPRWAPHRYERLGRFRDVLRLAALRAACEGRELDLPEFMPASVTDPPEDPSMRSDLDSERRAMAENVGRYLPVFTARARAILRHPPVQAFRSEADEWIADQSRQRRYRAEPDFGHRIWLAAFTDALLACEGEDVQLIRDASDAVPIAAAGSENACWMTIARRLAGDPRYRDEGLRILERAASFAERAELPASEQADALLKACAVADPIDQEQARDLHERAIVAAEGMDDEGIGRLEFHARVAAGLTGGPAARELAERVGQALVAHRLRVSDEDRLPWSATLRAIALLHPQTALALVGRWEDAGHMLLHHSVPAVAAPLVQSGFLTPKDALALLALAGEETNPVPAATALLAEISEGSARAEALSELSLRIRRDLVPDTRARAAYSLHEWAVTHATAQADSIRALVPLLTPAEEQHTSRPWTDSTSSERDKREQTVNAIIARAANGDPAAIESDLRALAEQFGSDRISRYLGALAEALIPSRRGEFVDALASLPADHPVAEFDADDLLDAIISAATAWSGSAALRTRCAEAIAQILEIHFESLTRFGERAERVVRSVLAQDYVEDPAELTLRAVGGSLERLSPAALYATASVLTLALGRDEQAEVLRWSLDGLDSEPAVPPDLPSQREDVLAALLWSLCAAPDKATRWRAAHVARRLLVAGDEPLAQGDEPLAQALFRCATSRDGGAFVSSGVPFYWLSGRVWALMLLARVARDRPETVAALAVELAAIARDAAWPHVGIREFARRGALRIANAIPGTLAPPVMDELHFVNAPRACKKDRQSRYAGSDRRRNVDYENERFHFNPMDTLPYIYAPFGRRFELNVDDICGRAERWIVDELGLNGDRIADPRVDRMDYSLSYASHGASPRVESWHQMLEDHALQLVAGELCDQDVPIVCEPYEDSPDPWDEWLRNYVDTMEDAWIVDERTPVPPVPTLLLTDIGHDRWPELTDAELERAIGAPAPETLVVAASVSLSTHFGYGSTYVTSALVNPVTASALARAVEAIKEPHYFALPLEHGQFAEEDDIDDGEFRLTGWQWEEYGENEGLEKHDPLARIGLSVTRPGSTFLSVCGAVLEAGGRRVRGPAGELLAWQRTWSDVTQIDDGRHESTGTHGRETHVRRDVLCELLRTTGSSLILHARASRSRRNHVQEESSEDRIHRVYLFEAAGRLATLDGPVQAR